MTVNSNKIYYSTDAGISWDGPFTREEFSALRSAGIISESALVRREGEEMSPSAESPQSTHLPSSQAAADAVPVPQPPPHGVSQKPDQPAASFSQQPPPPPPASEDSRSVLLAAGGKQYGPYTVSALKLMQTRGELTPHMLYWMDGMSEWKPVGELLGQTATAPPPLEKQVLGLQGFSLGNFFSGVFKHHTREEMDAILCCGSAKTIPSLLSINTAWPSPWLFARFFGLCIILLLVFAWMLDYVGYLALPGLVFAGTIGLPMCAFLLLFEMNVQRDVSLYRTLICIMLGGLISLAITCILNCLTAGLSGVLGAVWAGPVEETAKLAAVIVMASGMRNGKILTGVVLGAAVGTGFAIFETAGYLCETLMSLQGNWAAVLATMGIRAIGAWSGHTVYAAITGGAFWMMYALKIKDGQRRKDEDSMDFSCMLDKRFLSIAVIAVLLHMFHNSPFFQDNYFITRAIADVFGWIVVLRLVQKGLHQVREEQNLLLRK